MWISSKEFSVPLESKALIKDFSSETTDDTKPILRKVKPWKVLIREISDSEDESQASYFDPNIDPFSHERVKYLDGESH